MSEQTDVLIVGAGLAGLNAAQQLKDVGLSSILLDKGRRAGGRMATKVIGEARADHGAQFFSVRSPELRKRVDQWLADDLVYEWSRGWSDGSIQSDRPDGYPRYVVRGGMNELPQHLAKGLDVRPSMFVSQVIAEENSWRTLAKPYPYDEVEPIAFSSKALLLTPPVPQSMALLDNSGVQLPDHQRAILKKIEYGPCLAGLFIIDGVLGLPYPGALQRREADFSWIADNQRKGVAPNTRVVTVHASLNWSRAHYQDDPDAVLDAMWVELQAVAAGQIEMKQRLMHRWGYSIPLTTHSERILIAEGLPPLVLAGDAFGGPRVEGAILSGLAAGTSLMERLNA